MTATTTADRTPTAAPCLGCATIHGYIRRGRGRPARWRGLCQWCYKRAKRQGDVPLYPACGPRPVPYLGRSGPWYAAHPAPVPAGLAPILRPDRSRPVWTGLAIVKYPAPTWRTYRPRGRRLGEAA